MVQNNLSPIALFVYNRPIHTKRVLDSLVKNPEASKTNLYVFADGPEDINNLEEVQKISEIKSLVLQYAKGFNLITLIERSNNFGLANNIIDGISNVLAMYDTVIVVEDDIVVSCGFLNFMNKSLYLYEDHKKVGTIQGFQFPINFSNDVNTYFDYAVGCWGWATWRDRWKLFEPNGKKLWETINTNNTWEKFNINNSYNFKELLEEQIQGKKNSWAIRWYASLFVNDKLNLYPTTSLTLNIGNDGSGYHKSKQDTSHFPISDNTHIDLNEAEFCEKEVKKVINFRKKQLRKLKLNNFIIKFKINILKLDKLQWKKL